MIRRFAILALLMALVACKDDRPTAVSHVSDQGQAFTLIHLPGQTDVAIQIAWASDWLYRPDTNKAAPYVGVDLILAGGAEAFPPGTASERFADIGSEAVLYVATSDHVIGELVFAAEHLDETVEIARAHLQAPLFDPSWFDRVAATFAQNMAEARTQPAHAGFDALRWAVFGDQPLRNSLSLDDPATFVDLSRDDIITWKQETLTNRPEAVVIAGDLDPQTAGQALDRLLSGLTDPSPIARAVSVDFTPRRILLHMPEAETTILSLVAPLPPTRSGGEIEDLILIGALGGDDQSVLFDAIRTGLRASYSFGAGVANYSRDHRILFLTGEIETAKLAEAEALVRTSYADFRQNGLQGAIDDRKTSLAAYFADLPEFISDQARSELQSGLDGYAEGRSLQLHAEIEAVTGPMLRTRLETAFPSADALITIAVSADPTALPDACVIRTAAQAAGC